ncbi:hypothetical protein [Peredibacter starrii]|uniref:DUF983 domain-containing protein n=1 Tax=Peredibacter starrii TaxID=28202 RepID=A0AAX4HTK5_9BACT|nr:hypothetical protein [Peredibacter starrii]WPU66659.1 hypothetical protein SOO65_07865 [Peredibacter starrii]
MNFSFKKACPHCSQSLKFRVGDNYKKMIVCTHCNQELGFHCSRNIYFYGFSTCFWIVVSFFLLKNYPLVLTTLAILLFCSAIFTSIPLSRLIKGEEKAYRPFIPAFQMILLGTVVNTFILTLGIMVYTKVS